MAILNYCKTCKAFRYYFVNLVRKISGDLPRICLGLRLPAKFCRAVLSGLGLVAYSEQTNRRGHRQLFKYIYKIFIIAVVVAMTCRFRRLFVHGVVDNRGSLQGSCSVSRSLVGVHSVPSWKQVEYCFAAWMNKYVIIGVIILVIIIIIIIIIIMLHESFAQSDGLDL